MRETLATIAICYMIALALLVAIVRLVFPPEGAPLTIAGSSKAYAALFIARPIPPAVKTPPPPAKPPPPPKPPRLKGKLEPRDLFHFDQRTIA